MQDTIEFVRRILNTELNSATDNPMVFTQEQVDASESLRTSDGDRIACKDAPGGNGRKGDGQDIKAADASPPPATANAGAKPVDPLEAANRKIAALERQAGCEGCLTLIGRGR